MVSCRNCKHFKEEKIDYAFDGICWIAGEPDFMESWMIDEGECTFYEPLDVDHSKE